jgi:hydrogenase maturation protease
VSIKNTLILGFGSEMLSDEGLAVRLVEDLKNNWRETVALNTHLCFSLDVVQEIAGCNNLILIDTIEGEEAGMVNTCSVESYQPSLHLNNYHDISLKDGIELGYKLGFNMPSKIVIITISISRIGYISDLVSSEIETTYARILTKVENMIKDSIYQPAL